MAQSAPRCQGGIVFAVIHQKNAGKCPPVLGDGNSNSSCLQQQDIDYSSIHIEAPKNRFGWQGGNFRYVPGATTQAAIDESKRNRVQASKNARAAADAKADAQRNANIASFKRQASSTLTASSRGYGLLAVNRMADQCFPSHAKQAVCKDFVIISARFRIPSRADKANGIASIIDVKASALSQLSPASQWREICSSSTFVSGSNGQWRLSNSYSNC